MEGTRCNGELWVTVKPAPLKCGRYEHVEEVSDCFMRGDAMVCTGDTQPGSLNFWTNKTHPVCAHDLHAVTEKEWQELMGRLKRLEAR